MPPTQDRQLKIVSCQQVYSGTNSNGHHYTIFEVTAARPDTGEPIKEKLRSFVALPCGETRLWTVTPFESERHGRSFTLHRKQSTNTTGQVNELKERLAALEQRVAELEARLAQPANSTPQTW